MMMMLLIILVILQESIVSGVYSPVKAIRFDKKPCPINNVENDENGREDEESPFLGEFGEKFVLFQFLTSNRWSRAWSAISSPTAVLVLFITLSFLFL
jgi:hypothetical protein